MTLTSCKGSLFYNEPGLRNIPGALPGMHSPGIVNRQTLSYLNCLKQQWQDYAESWERRLPACMISVFSYKKQTGRPRSQDSA